MLGMIVLYQNKILPSFSCRTDGLTLDRGVHGRLSDYEVAVAAEQTKIVTPPTPCLTTT